MQEHLINSLFCDILSIAHRLLSHTNYLILVLSSSIIIFSVLSCIWQLMTSLSGRRVCHNLINHSHPSRLHSCISFDEISVTGQLQITSFWLLLSLVGNSCEFWCSLSLLLKCAIIFRPGWFIIHVLWFKSALPKFSGRKKKRIKCV